jgi:hypothetical protein
MSVDPVLKYYSDLLIRQYKTGAKAVQTVQLMADQSYIDGFALEESLCFDLDTAVGNQLTILGKIVGVPRTVYILNSTHNYEDFIRYTGTPNPLYTFGMGRYTDSPYDPNAYLFFRYQFKNSGVYTLLDFEMRTLIRLKIILNNSYSSFAEIIGAIYQYFNPYITVVDNKNMTLTYNVSSNISSVGAAAVSLGLLPKPAGVGLIVNYV